MRRKYHPRDQEQGLKDRNKLCQEVAEKFASEEAAGELHVAAQNKAHGADG